VRVPDAQERYFSQARMGSDWVGNPALVPAKNTETNLGLSWRRRTYYLKTAAFYSMYGGELTYGWSIGARWVISGGASYVRGGKDPAPALNIYDTNLPEIPPLRGRTAVRYGTRRWFAEAEGIAAWPQRRTDTDLRETATAGFGVANIKLGIHLRHIAITGGIDNLFDHPYFEHLSFQRDPFRNGSRVPEPGRNLFVSASYSF